MHYRTGNCKNEGASRSSLQLECPANSKFISFFTRNVEVINSISGANESSLHHCILCKYLETLNVTLCSIPKKLPHTDVAWKIKKVTLSNYWSCLKISGSVVDGSDCKIDGSTYSMCGIYTSVENIDDSFLGNSSNHITKCSYTIDVDEVCHTELWTALIISFASIFPFIFFVYKTCKQSIKIKDTKRAIQRQKDIPLESRDYDYYYN